MSSNTRVPKRFEEVSLLNEEEGLSEKHDQLPADPIRHQRRKYTTRAALIFLFLAAVLILTIIAIATQKIPSIKTTDSKSKSSQPGDLPTDAKLALNPSNPNVYTYPHLGNVVAKTEGCGASPQEAKAKGCIFDFMNYHWIRPECYYEEGSKEAEKKGPWTFYRDRNFTELIPGQDAESLSTETVVYTQYSWHVVHCVYALKSVHRAAMTGKWLPEEEASWPHTLHCSEVFQLMGTPADANMTRIDMQFLGCVKFGDD